MKQENMIYNRTRYGKFMYSLLYKPSIFLGKHKWLYYVLNCTWGIFLTFVGWIITLALLICGKKPRAYHGIYYFELGKYWGGFETGLMYVRDKCSSEYVNYHELGHTYQNAILGPFQIFLVAIPSVVRYWFREITKNKEKSYDNIWFEGSASDIGEKIVEMDNLNWRKKK